MGCYFTFSGKLSGVKEGYLVGQLQLLLGPLYLKRFLLLQLSNTKINPSSKNIIANVFLIVSTKIER